MRLRQAEAERESGELAEADRLLQTASRWGFRSGRERAADSLRELRSERLAVVDTLYAAALAVESRETIQVAEALAWYEAALSLSVEEDPNYEAMRSRAGELRDVQRRRLEAHRAARKELLRVGRSCEGDVDSALREVVSLAYEADLHPPSVMAWRLAETCFEEGRYEQAASLAERARRLEAYHFVEPPEAEALIKMALSLHRTGVRGPLVAAVTEPDPEVEAAQMEERARAARRAARPTASVGPARRQTSAPARARIETSPEPEPQPEEEPEPPPPGPEARNALARARRLHEQGDSFAALVALDQAMASHPEHPERHLLVDQRARWESLREELVGEHLQRAEAALAAQRPDEAAELYERILALEPEHAVSRDRLRRIEHLRSLR
ncbi:MAG: hypothetical protein ACOCVR_02680 [Myxococcota bacterium]